MADLFYCVNTEGGAQSPAASSIRGPLGPHFICETKLPSPASPMRTTANWHSKPPITAEHVPKSLSSRDFNYLLSLYFVAHSHSISIFTVHAVA